MVDSESSIQGAWRPHRNLVIYYCAESLLLGPFFPLLLVPRLIRFRTLRYEFDDKGVSVSWGALFRREVSLNYERIQDIHLASNLVERWLGLARIEVQTAAGSSKAEMTIEGLRDFAAVRNYLYNRMRGSSPEPEDEDGLGDAVTALRQATAELRALRRSVEARRGGSEP